MPDRVYPYLENHPANAAPERCKMCGAVKIGTEYDHHKGATEAETILLLAHMHERDPLATRLLLKRVVNPYATYAELAKGTKLTRDRIGKKLRAIAESVPELRPLLGLMSPKALAQQRRRVTESIQTSNLPQKNQKKRSSLSLAGLFDHISKPPGPDENGNERQDNEMSEYEAKTRKRRNKIRAILLEEAPNIPLITDLVERLAALGIKSTRWTVGLDRKRILTELGPMLILERLRADKKAESDTTEAKEDT